MSTDTLGKLIDILVALIVMFIVPVMWQGYEMDKLTQKNVESITEEFCETISSRGYIDRQSINDYQRRLDANGSLYRITLVHSQEIYEPEYVGGVFTGNVISGMEESYTAEIYEAIEAKGAYIMDIGDTIKVIAEPSSLSLGQKFMKVIFRNTNSRFASVSKTVSGWSEEQITPYLY